MANRIPLLCRRNAWDPEFYNLHDLTGKDDVPAVEALKEAVKDSGHDVDPLDEVDSLTVLLGDSEDSGCPREADEVRRYCGEVSLTDLQAGRGEAGKRRGAWHDHRDGDVTGSGSLSLCKNPLTATELLRCLKKTVWTKRHLT
jgi:hypothetical protein